jgi:hypothetical protein
MMTTGRDAALEGRTDGVAYFEWSADGAAPGYDPRSPDTWWQAHPALGYTIDEGVLADELALATGPGGGGLAAFERSALNVWPRPSAGGRSGLDLAAWAECSEPAATVGVPRCYVVDYRPDAGGAAIARAGPGGAGLVVAEVVDQRAGTGWVLEQLAVIRRGDRGATFAADAVSCAALIADATRAGFPLEALDAATMTGACAGLVDLVGRRQFRHRAQAGLDTAVLGAARRPVGDGWAWSRSRSVDVDISPLVAVTLAAWCHRARPAPGPPRVVAVAG